MIGVQYHRVLDKRKLFCRCTYKKIQKKDEEVFQIPYFNGQIKTYRTAAFYCDYEKEQKPAELNRKVFIKALKTIKRIPEIVIPDQIVFCRKRIMDNSLPAGYQITGLIGWNGSIVLDSGKKCFLKAYLQQDSCSVDGEGFKVDRLGLPLLQIVSDPLMLSGTEAKELLLKIENLLNFQKNLPVTSFCRRQDINISTEDHPCVQIKGVCRISDIPFIIEKQQKRQKEANPIEKKAHTRKVDVNGKSAYLRSTTGNLFYFFF